jgi:hypothetical protein
MICGGQSGTGAGFLKVFQFPCQSFIPPVAQQSSSYIIQDWCNRAINGLNISGCGYTPPTKNRAIVQLEGLDKLKNLIGLIRTSTSNLQACSTAPQPYLRPCAPIHKIVKQTNSMALSPQASYTDWVTATCRRNLMPTFVDRGVSCGQRGGSPTVINLSFLDQSRYFSFK